MVFVQAETEEGQEEANSEGADEAGPSNILFPDGKPGKHSSSEPASRSGLRKHHHTNSSSSLAPARPVSPIGMNANGQHGKESLYVLPQYLERARFDPSIVRCSLNYFFGGAGPNGLPMAANSNRGPRSGSLPDLTEERSDNPLAGRRGLEGNAAAFDMKSLNRHIEPVRGFCLCWALLKVCCCADIYVKHNLSEDIETSTTEREDMETALLQSLIAAYFNIVRQTIQDVVPKVRKRRLEVKRIYSDHGLGCHASAGQLLTRVGAKSSGRIAVSRKQI